MRRFSNPVQSFILYRTWHAGLLTAHTWTRRAVQLSTQINIVLLPWPTEQRNTCFLKKRGGVAFELESVYPVYPTSASTRIDSTTITTVTRHSASPLGEKRPHCRLRETVRNLCVCACVCQSVSQPGICNIRNSGQITHYNSCTKYSCFRGRDLFLE